MRIRRHGMRVHQLQRATLFVLAIGAFHQEHRAHATVTNAAHDTPGADALAFGWIGGDGDG
jgi:hypothetical protein